VRERRTFDASALNGDVQRFGAGREPRPDIIADEGSSELKIVDFGLKIGLGIDPGTKVRVTNSASR
jgi:hypothetical protein